MPADAARLPPAMLAFNAVVLAILLYFSFQWAIQNQLWDFQKGTILSFYIHKAWPAIPIFLALAPVAAYSVPLLYLRKAQARRKALVSASNPAKIEKLDNR